VEDQLGGTRTDNHQGRTQMRLYLTTRALTGAANNEQEIIMRLSSGTHERPAYEDTKIAMETAYRHPGGGFTSRAIARAARRQGRPTVLVRRCPRHPRLVMRLEARRTTVTCQSWLRIPTTPATAVAALKPAAAGVNPADDRSGIDPRVLASTVANDARDWFYRRRSTMAKVHQAGQKIAAPTNGLTPASGILAPAKEVLGRALVPNPVQTAPSGRSYRSQVPRQHLTPRAPLEAES